MSYHIYQITKELYRLRHNDQVKDIFIENGEISLKSDILTSDELKVFKEHYKRIK